MSGFHVFKIVYKWYQIAQKQNNGYKFFRLLWSRIGSLLWFTQLKNSSVTVTHGNPEEYSEPCQISKMERFEKIVNGF